MCGISTEGRHLHTFSSLYYLMAGDAGHGPCDTYWDHCPDIFAVEAKKKR